MFRLGDEEKRQARRDTIIKWVGCSAITITLAIFILPAINSAKHAPAEVTRIGQKRKLEFLKYEILSFIIRTGRPPTSSKEMGIEFYEQLFSAKSPDDLSDESYAFHPEFLQIRGYPFLSDIPIAYAPPVDDDPLYVALFLDGSIRDISFFELETGREYAKAILQAKEFSNQ